MSSVNVDILLGNKNLKGAGPAPLGDVLILPGGVKGAGQGIINPIEDHHHHHHHHYQYQYQYQYQLL